SDAPAIGCIDADAEPVAVTAANGGEGRPSKPTTVTSESRGEFVLDHGAVVIASITSCTNTSNPSVMLGAALLAKNAVEKGLAVKPWVKTSMAPGSKVVTDYYEKAGTMDFDFEHQPLGQDTTGNDVFLRDIWPSPQDVQATIDNAINQEMFTKDYADVFAGDERWRSLPTPEGDTFEWDPESTY